MLIAPEQLVLDAGPLIGLFYALDAYHQEAVSGFEQLKDARAGLVVPLPIVFEVYKFLLYRSGAATARRSLQGMRQALSITEVRVAQLDELQRVLEAMPDWRGSLEDALVALTAERHACPVWTLNYRDFSAFKGLELWTPRCLRLSTPWRTSPACRRRSRRRSERTFRRRRDLRRECSAGWPW